MANMPVIYPPRGDYTTVGSELGNVGGIWLAGLLKKNKEDAEDAKIMQAAKSLEQVDNRNDAFSTVGLYVQNGTLTKPEHIAKFYNLIDQRFPVGSDRVISVYDVNTGAEKKVAAPKKPGGITQDADLEGLVGPGFTLTKPDVDEFYQQDGTNVKYVGKFPTNKRPAGKDVYSKSEIDMREKLTTAQRLQNESDDRAIDRALRAEERIARDLDRKNAEKEGKKPSDSEREAKAMLRRRGAEPSEENMDKAMYVSRKLDDSQRTLLTLAGGRIKDNAVMWDNEGNQVRFGQALRQLENNMWNGMNEYEAAAAAWKEVGGGVPQGEKLDTTPSSGATEKGPFVTGKVRGPDVPAGPAVTPNDKWGDTKPGTKQQDTLRGRVDEALKKVPPKAAAPAATAPATPTVAPSAKPSGAPATRTLPMEGGKALESQMKDGELYVIGKEVYKWDAKTRKLHKLNKQ
jgi:hypothetical protein